MTDPVALHPRNIGAALREPPQRRGAERAQADNDNVFIDDFHQG